MRRLLTVFVVMAVMAAMVAASAVPAFANAGQGKGGFPEQSTNGSKGLYTVCAHPGEQHAQKTIVTC